MLSLFTRPLKWGHSFLDEPEDPDPRDDPHDEMLPPPPKKENEIDYARVPTYQ
tara:strand:+ start:1172 stop:1330 length:159 start_codon:yes stop_codon:yes gene_type:complete